MDAMKEHAGYARTRNTLKLLKIILDHGIISSKYISSMLNITERQILKYVSDLRKCGINVKSKVGPGGGYYIDDWKCPVCNNKTYIKPEE